MDVDVYIENEAGSTVKNLHDEESLQHRGSVGVARPYPLAYGFIIGTRSGDGDCLDCYVISQARLRTGDIVRCRVVDLMEQSEDGLDDHNIIAIPLSDEPPFDASYRETLVDFVEHVFDDIPGKQVVAGAFRGQSDAEAHVLRCRTPRSGGP
jgi:inorganic pyrophosphatase